MNNNVAGAEPAKKVTQAERVAPIDLVHLARQTLGDAKLEYEILGMFRQMAATYNQRLRKCLNDDEIALNLHALRGAALGVGATSVAGAARTAEHELSSVGKLSAATLDALDMAVHQAARFIEELND